MRYFRKTFVVIFGILIVIALILLVVSAIFFYGYKTQMSKLRASGRYSTLAGFQTPKVPADQNAATIYTKLINRKVDRKLYPDYFRLRKIVYVTRNGANQDLWNEARAIVDKNKGICDQIREAAERPYCVYPVDWSQYNPRHLFNYADILRYASGVDQAEALLGAMDGKPDYAEPIYACIRMSECLRDQPDYMTQLSRYLILGATCDALLRTFDYRDMSQRDMFAPFQCSI